MTYWPEQWIGEGKGTLTVILSNTAAVDINCEVEQIMFSIYQKIRLHYLIIHHYNCFYIYDLNGLNKRDAVYHGNYLDWAGPAVAKHVLTPARYDRVTLPKKAKLFHSISLKNAFLAPINELSVVVEAAVDIF